MREPIPKTHPERFLSMKGVPEVVDDFVRKAKNSSELASVIDLGGTSPDLTFVITQWAMIQWIKSQKPIVVLDEYAAWSLSHRDPPWMELPPKVHLSGVYGAYVTLPPVFEVRNDESGMHAVEGLYLFEDHVYRDPSGKTKSRIVRLPQPEAERQGVRLERVVGFVVVGKTKPLTDAQKKSLPKGMSPEWVDLMYEQGNDAIQWGCIGKDTNLERLFAEAKELGLDGFSEGVKLGLNLLYLLGHGSTELHQEAVVPRIPKSSAKAAKMERNKSTLPYMRVSLASAPPYVPGTFLVPSSSN